MQGFSGDDVGTRLPGLRLACEALEDGLAAVVPNPAPMAYGVVATTAEAVNSLKKRPPAQNVAVSLHDESQRQEVASAISLPPTILDAVGALLRSRLTVLVPLRRGVRYPAWIGPAVHNGQLAIFNGFWAPTARLWKQFPRLYGSSANVTGEPPATSAAQALAMFGASCPIVDADALPGQSGHRWSSTMVRIDRTGRLELYRSGAHDASSGLSALEYERRLAASIGLPVDDSGAATHGGNAGLRKDRRW